ncbi:MAG: phosphopantothenoylcysteine synthase [Verrucomicrobia bacterium]|nr:phosphopantothenoylcysteine synthase [Verrucomicrobiota bacterium]
MRVVITGGPSSEAVDEVRIITNRSTGELAVKLARTFQGAGWLVDLFLGFGAIHKTPTAKSFHTNEDLLKLLNGIINKSEIHLVLHAAALSDFAVAFVETGGIPVQMGKIPSNITEVKIGLRSKPKLIQNLRALFPRARIVGWKLEQDGGREQVIQSGIEQIHLNGTDLCILNGRGFGDGFGICNAGGMINIALTKDELAGWLLGWTMTDDFMVGTGF